MPEIRDVKELIALLKRWADERPESAVFPRVAGNPYGDNTIGVAWDNGWWTCAQMMRDRGWLKDGALG